MRKIPFSNFQSVARWSRGRQLVMFGAGNICRKTVRKLTRQPAFIADNSANLWDAEQDGIAIRNPVVLKDDPQQFYVLICTTSFREVSKQLEELGFKPEEDFLVSPILNDLRIIDELENTRAKLLFSSGGQPANDGKIGGGLYELTLDRQTWEYRKVLSGSCHSIVEVDGSLYTVDDELGLTELDHDYRVIRNCPLQRGSRGHGLGFHAESKQFFIACSYLDKVLSFDFDMKPVAEFPLSEKCGGVGGPFHHTNDCCVVGDSLYVSMFSETGNWKRDVFDGCVMEFDIMSGKKVGTPVRDLWMPHNIMYLDGSLTVLDSLRGGLLRNNMQMVGQFPAFARGLAFNGEYFFVGQSRNRNFSKNLGISKNISIDTGIVVFDEITKVSRLLQLPSSISEVHGIHYLSEG